jgi:hypothetical protein
MTSQDLYPVYVQAYLESSHFQSRPLAVPETGIGSRLRRLLSVARLIEELGRDDATDGRPMRTRQEFERAFHQALPLLEGMGRLAEAAP